MLSFFRINDPFRLLGVLVILGLVRAVFFFQVPPLLLPELNLLIIGEKLGQGATMYVDVWDKTAPLSALIYWGLHYFLGNSILPYRILAILLIFIQSVFLNWVLIRKNVYNEKSYLPALFYVLFACSTFDMLTLSPSLMSLTFLLLVFRNILSLNEEAFDNEIFKTGIYLGIAILLYLPNFVFIFFIAIGFALFRTASTRQYLLFIYGISFIFSFFVIYYFWVGKLHFFFQNFLSNIFDFNWASYLSWKTIIAVMLLPSLFLIVSLLRVFNETSFINFQSNTQLLMLIWLAISLISNVFAPNFGTYQLILLAPVFSIFITYFFLLYRKKLLKEILFLALIVLIGFNGYASAYPWGRLQDYINYENLYANKPKDFAFSQQKILVLGENLSYYRDNQLATPYLDWELSQAHFAYLDTYASMIATYENLEKDLPEIIIDEAGFAEKLFAKISILQSSYTKQGKFYFLKKEARKI
jgi:hypothetical protein